MDDLVGAIIEKKREVVHRLLQTGMELNYICDGSAPIHWAALVGDVECLRLLLQFGADPNLVDLGYAQNAVHKAADQSVEILICSTWQEQILICQTLQA